MLDVSFIMSTLAEQITAFRREIITKALVEARFNRTKAAELLGVTPRLVFRFCADELTDHDRNVIAAKCVESGGIDPKSLAGSGRL